MIMDNIRLLLLFALAFVLLLIYQAWMEDYGTPGQTPSSQTAAPEVAPPSGLPQITTAETPQVPAPEAQPAPVPNAAPQAAPEDLITVQTDVLKAQISRRGGSLASVWLTDYPVSPERPEEKFRLFKPTPPNLFFAQSGLIGSDRERAPTHEALFHAEQTNYALAPTEDSLAVVLT